MDCCDGMRCNMEEQKCKREKCRNENEKVSNGFTNNNQNVAYTYTLLIIYNIYSYSARKIWIAVMACVVIWKSKSASEASAVMKMRVYVSIYFTILKFVNLHKKYTLIFNFL